MLWQFSILAAVLATTPTYAYTVKPFNISLAGEVPALKAQLNATLLPSRPVAGVNDSYGVSLTDLEDFRNKWLALDWAAEESRMNSYHHYTTEIENTTIHFVHEKSSHPGAIPIIITHGWPGSFFEYLPVVRPLLELAEGTLSNGTNRSITFDVVLPSIPGFTFSSEPPTAEGRDVAETANMWNTLMVDVLGYDHGYAVAGSDWGACISWHNYDLHPESVRAAYLTMFPFLPPTPADIAAANQTLTPFEQSGAERWADFNTHDFGYFIEQTNKPNSIGLALYDHAVGQLAWLVELFTLLIDPINGQFTQNDILTEISLYHLTKTFLSSVFIYAFNPDGFSATHRKANTAAPMAYGEYKYDIAHWPEYFVKEVGNLVFHRQHENGGHFPGLDNPTQYVQDIRDFLAEYFTFSS